MRALVNKAMLVLCMLAVVTGQLYSSALAMPMDTHYLSPSQVHSFHVVDSNENTQKDEGLCCEMMTTEQNHHCTTSQSSSDHNCDEMTDCAQSHCASSVGCGFSQYILDIEPIGSISFTVNNLFLSQSSVSLYRPPIFR